MSIFESKADIGMNAAAQPSSGPDFVDVYDKLAQSGRELNALQRRRFEVIRELGNINREIAGVAAVYEMAKREAAETLAKWEAKAIEAERAGRQEGRDQDA